jgi:transposase-like protein
MQLDIRRDGWRSCRFAAKIGCTAQTLLECAKIAEVNSGQGGRSGVPSEMAEKLQALERESRELRQANEIQRYAAACLPGGARRRVQAMITFIYDYREVLGSSRSAGSCCAR